MKSLSDCKEEIHSCSKCGLCQSVCPVYKITGNDCTVSRGQFIMLQGLIKGELKMSETINRYLDLCLKCGACSKFCPSGIDVIDIVALAKAEYLKFNAKEKFKLKLLKSSLKILNFINLFAPKKKSKTFEKKVIYFGGCGSKIEGNKYIVDILNSAGTEVITPNFECCGFPFFVKGDLNAFKFYMDKFYQTIEKYDNIEILTNCATCEKSLKSYKKWSNKVINVKNVFEYLRENNIKFELKKKANVTYHKPCNLENYDDVLWVLKNTKNLNYIQMDDYDKCCGMQGIFNFKERKIMSQIYRQKRNNILNTKTNPVLTSCLACRLTLKLYSFGKYKVNDLLSFLSKNINKEKS